MQRIGCCARFFNTYKDEVKFAKEHGFEFLQLWYDKDGIALHKDKGNEVAAINTSSFPAIIHAVLDIADFREHIPKIIDIMRVLKHKDLIIHPICTSEKITENSIKKLSGELSYTLEMTNEEGITVYLENNSLIEPIFTSKEEFELIFREHRELKLLLDIAHIQSYEHLGELLSVKKPSIIHIADKHFDVIHEHLPIGKGELDFKHILQDIMKDFLGDIILEVVTSDEDIVESKNHIVDILRNR